MAPRLLLAAGACLIAAACAGSGATPSGAASPSLMATPTPTPSAAAPVSASPAVGTLRAAAGRRVFGTAVALPQLDTDPAYRTVLAREFSAVTPENAMKWASVEPTQGKFDWTAADEIVAFAAANGQQVHGHNLVWYNQVPSWLSSGSFKPDQLRVLLQAHISLEVSRFRGKIAAWDVVNEPFDDSGTLRDDVWSQALGPGYIADALRWAHAADPAAKLFINDYDIEGINAKSNAMYELVKSLKAAGVPIDGVGFQAHLEGTTGLPGDFAANLQRFADLGVEVEVTELDVRLALPATTDLLARQAETYSRVVKACTAVTACIGVTVWGFTDKYSWVPGFFQDEGAACLFDDNIAPKPAYQAVLNALSGASR